MDNANVFDAAIKRAELTAKTYQTTMLTGQEAFEKDDKVARRNLADQTFADGDTVEIPQLPSASAEDAKKWISLPINRGGEPVTRVLCKVTDKNGKVSVKELFAGTFRKFVRNRDTQVDEFSKGTAVDAVADCVSNTEIWQTLAGKTVVFSNPRSIPTVIRGFNGRPDRNGNQTVWDINYKA
jgi:hypothetical protein